jgi:hypothetical protein
MRVLSGGGKIALRCVSFLPQVLTDAKSHRSFRRTASWGLGRGNDGVALLRIVGEQ